MFIKEIYLKGYKWIDVLGDIKEITITSTNVIQLLLGTNGSGKSSILQELTPFPAKKSDYNKGGKKIITIHFNNEEYILISDFSTTKGEHRFLVNGNNLNVSGLSTLQIDLCREHFGYTQLADDLVHCRYKMVDMDISKRKALLLSISPSTPEFIIDLHKKSKSLLREYKSNLNLLHTRKTEIENKLINESEFKVLLHRYKDLEKEQLKMSNELYLLDNKITEHAKKLESMGNSFHISDYETGIKKIRTLLQDNLFRNKLTFPRFEYDNYISNNEDTLIELRVTHEQHLSNYDKLQSEIVQHKDTVKIDDDFDIDKLKISLDEQMTTLTSIVHWKKYPCIEHESIDMHQQVSEKLYQYINNNIPSTNNWKHIDKLNNISNKISIISEKIYHLETDKKYLTDKIVEDETFLSSSLKGPTLITDNCRSCDYMTTLSTRTTETKNTLVKRKQRLTIVNTKLTRYLKTRNKLVNVNNYINNLNTFVINIHNYIKDTIWKMDREKIINILSGDYKSWLHDVNLTMFAQGHLRNISSLEQSIMKIGTIISTLEQMNDPSVKMLNSIMTNKHKQIDDIKIAILNINNDILHIEDSIKNIENMKNTHIRLSKIVESFDEHIEYHFLSYYIDYLKNYVLSDYKKIKEDIDKELYELTKTIKTQESLQARYKEEVISLIEKITRQQDIVNYIEMGLSPESGMPHHHVLNFINAILENVNFVLSKIWSVPFKIDLLLANEEVTCDFKARCNNKVPTSLNKLSKSQKAAVNFAFCISLIYATKSDGYPIILDEMDEGFDSRHKELFFDWLKIYIDNQYSPQMWLVSHDANFYTGFLYKDIVCLHKDNVVVPDDVNLYTEIIH